MDVGALHAHCEVRSAQILFELQHTGSDSPGIDHVRARSQRLLLPPRRGRCRGPECPALPGRALPANVPNCVIWTLSAAEFEDESAPAGLTGVLTRIVSIGLLLPGPIDPPSSPLIRLCTSVSLRSRLLYRRRGVKL